MTASAAGAELASALAAGAVFLDTRASCFFNGWPDGLANGHVAGAINCVPAWLDDEHFRHRVLARINGRPVLVYGAPDAVAAVQCVIPAAKALAGDLAGLGLPLQQQPGFRLLMPAHWLHTHRAGFQVVEAGDDNRQAYREAHIPGAAFIDTNEVEDASDWNRVADSKLREIVSGAGIKGEWPVVVYGRDPMAAARVGLLMRNVGVRDVRLLDGGFAAWCHANLPLEHGQPSLRVGGFTASPAARCVADLEEVQAHLAAGHKAVSIRSLAEYRGETSGYSYFSAAGELPGAKWGHAGDPDNFARAFRNPDQTMRDPDEIARFWAAQGVDPAGPLIFYCGTGWRAAEAYFYARVLGWRDVKVYDGGWLEWSRAVASATQ